MNSKLSTLEQVYIKKFVRPPTILMTIKSIQSKSEAKPQLGDQAPVNQKHLKNGMLYSNKSGTNKNVRAR